MLGNIKKNLQNIPQTSEPSGNSPYFVQENCFSVKSSSFFIVAIGDFVFLRPLVESYVFLLIIGSEYCGTSSFIFCEMFYDIFESVTILLVLSQWFLLKQGFENAFAWQVNETPPLCN